MTATTIEWTDTTWNPVTGLSTGFQYPFFFIQGGGQRPKQIGKTLDGHAWEQFPTGAQRSA